MLNYQDTPPFKNQNIIVKWAGYPVGLIYETGTLPPPLRYNWVKNCEFGPCSQGSAVSLEEAKAQFERFWFACLDKLGLMVKP